ncbi:hypothetical protein ABZ848_13655 [Streptomyces sp. NPDC047081]|uniref:hypothetical protein n=1 Tax=Streptomyces sp. NPDC047081 TaxID=3154706 RepID=UPI0033C43FCF
MAVTPSKNGDDSVGYFWTKDEADKIKHKLNGLSTSVDILKVAAGVAAFGITPIKIDAAFFKMDEKGIVVGGVQRFTWPHARDEKAKLDSAERKLVKTSQQAEKAYAEAARATGMAKRLQDRLGASSWGATTETKNAVNAKKEADKAFSEMKETNLAIARMAQEAEDKKKIIARQKEDAEASLKSMESRLSTLSTKMRELESVAAGS